MDITPLDPAEWRGFALPFRYVSNCYYDVKIAEANEGFRVDFIKKPFAVPYEKTPDDTDKLFQPWWDGAKAWGIIEGGRLAAAIETAVEEWNGRLRVTELWVDGPYRRKGLASALMDAAVKRAKDENLRALVLVVHPDKCRTFFC